MRGALPDSVARRLGSLARYELRVLLFAFGLSLVAIPFGLLLHQVATDGPLTNVDERGAQWLNDRVHGHRSLITALQVISFLGKPVFLVFAVGVPAIYLLRHGGRRLTLFLGITCLGGGLVDTVVKEIVDRPRPDVSEPIITAYGKSFPSGHSMQAVVCYGALLLVFLPILAPRLRPLAIGAALGLAVLIGASRLSLGVHYVTDVLGGFVLGAAWLAASVAAFEIWRVERGRPRTNVLEEGVEPEEAHGLVDATPT